MKRLIVAASLAALAGSSFALEIGKPFEQTELDRVLPNIAQVEATPTVYAFNGSAPYEQLAIDRALPNIEIRGQSTQVAAAGATRSDAVDGADEAAQSPFAHQFDVVTPAP